MAIRFRAFLDYHKNTAPKRRSYLFYRVLGIEPVIWRQFQVTDDYRFDRFHQVIQIVMGWTNSHLHEFRVKDQLIGMVLEDNYDLPDPEDETILYLRDIPLEKGDMLNYLYDFGDDWEHILDLEDISDAPFSDPVCTAGEYACPPEDCGGVRGYSNLEKILKNPDHPEYDEWKEWLRPQFDPNIFSLKEVNKELKKFGAWHRKHPRAKSTPWHQLE